MNIQAFKKIGSKTIKKLSLPCRLVAFYVSSAAKTQPANNNKRLC